MTKTSTTLICDSLKSNLPATLCVQDYSAGVTDLCIDGIHNIPKCQIQVHADETTYDVHLSSTRCTTGRALAALLQKNLTTFAKVECKDSVINLECLGDDTKVTIPPKLSKVTGLPSTLSKGHSSSGTSVDLFGHLKRIYVCANIVEPMIVGSNYLPVLYYGEPNYQDNTPRHYRLIVSHLSQFNMYLLDSNLDPLNTDRFAALISLRSP